MKGPWRITLDTNPDDCNFRCIMCEEFSRYSNLKQLRLQRDPTIPKKRRMDPSMIREIVRQVAEYGDLKEIIPSTMGEPLLYKDFDIFVELCREYGVKLNLTTNGSFPGRGVKSWARLLVPVLSDVKISWNGMTEETQERIMVNSNYEKQVDNLRSFLEIRDQYFEETGSYCTVTLQVTFMEDNYREFPELVRFAASLGVDRIKGHHLWVHSEHMREQSMRRSKDSIERWNAVVREMRAVAETSRRPDGTMIRLDNIYELEEDATELLIKDSVCPFLGREVWIAWDGRFNPCCAPDEQRQQLVFFGNLRDTAFREIWEGEQYTHLVEKYNEHPLCKRCNMRRPKDELEGH